MKKVMNERGEGEIGGLLTTVFVLVGVGGWLTHIVYCFTHAAWGLLIGGALFFPVGIIHGWGRWFGWW